MILKVNNIKNLIKMVIILIISKKKKNIYNKNS